tara:strand:+ start:1937 stop:2284 length:348 start_codon:yes stop_codon:yes gene_type:complete
LPKIEKPPQLTLNGSVAKFYTLKLSWILRYNAPVCKQELPMVSFSGRHYPKFIILQCVRWYVAYALSYRNIEEMMGERGFEIDHATLNRWVLHYAPLLEKKAKKYKVPIHRSWRT